MSIALGKWPEETDSERVARIAANFSNMTQNLFAEKGREVRNWQFYSGLNNGQWDVAAIAHLEKERRPAHTFNYIQRIIDKIAGIFLQSPYKTVYRAYKEDEGKINLAQELFDFDRSNGNWEYEEARFIVSGLIYRAVGEYYMDYSYTPTGDIGWRAINPQPIYTDPFWKSGKICDLRWVCDPRWMSVEDIAEYYGTKATEVRMALKELRNSSQNFAPDVAAVSERTDEFYDMTSGQYRVITFTYMDRKSISKIVNLKTREEVVFPDEETKAAALKHKSDTYKEEIEYRKVCRVVTICPGLSGDLILSEGTHPLQLGHVPYFFWAAKDVWGTPHTPVDVLRSAQEVVNKRESTITHVLATMANNTKIGNAEAFDPTEQSKISQNINKPGQIFWAKTVRGNLRDAIIPIGPDRYPDGVEKDLERARDFITGLLPPAAQGEASGANQTGAHFTKVLSQAMSGLEVSNQGLQSVWRERAMSYLSAAKTAYSGVQRRRFNPNTQHEFWLNRPVVAEPTPGAHVSSDGEMAVENDVSNLTRYDVIVTQAQSGSTVGDQNLNAMTQAMQTVQNPIMRSVLEYNMVKFIPGLDEATKDELQEKGKIFVDFQHAQINSQLQMLQQPPQPPQQPGMGGPAEAARAPGMGGIPSGSGIAGSESMANNMRSPSDMRPR